MVLVPLCALAIETSGPFAFVAAQNSKGEQLQCCSTSSQQHNEELARLVEKTLSQLGMVADDLERVVVGCGPGSFTGLRIGYSFAQGLALGLKIPVVEIPSLTALGTEFLTAYQGVCVLSDARRDEYFWSLGNKAGFTAPQIGSLGEINAAFADWVPAGKGCFAGFGEISGIALTTPQKAGLSLLNLGLGRSEPAFSIAQVSALEPVYLRAVSARTIAERSKTAG